MLSVCWCWWSANFLILLQALVICTFFSISTFNTDFYLLIIKYFQNQTQYSIALNDQVTENNQKSKPRRAKRKRRSAYYWNAWRIGLILQTRKEVIRKIASNLRAQRNTHQKFWPLLLIWRRENLRYYDCSVHCQPCPSTLLVTFITFHK